jgi:Phenylalanyl-tRNA synthetase alpha subunit
VRGSSRASTRDAPRIENEELERLYAKSSFDVTLPGETPQRGRLHILTQVKREIEDVFLGMGFEVYEGDEVTDAWHNFDALTTDPGHPSRSPTDTFYLSDDVLLRTHTSPDQIRLMESRQPPIYAIMPGRCYRRDTPDATHSPTFLRSRVSSSTAASRCPISRAWCSSSSARSSAPSERCACGRATSPSPSRLWSST